MKRSFTFSIDFQKINKSKKKATKKKVSNIMLVLTCSMIILYTAAHFALQYLTSIEVSPTLTTAWFSFWGIELINLTFIKTSKVKYGQDCSQVEQEIGK